MMQRAVVTFILLGFSLSALKAQTDFTGRVYHNANIFGDKMSTLVSKAMPEAKAKAIAEKEKEIGRKLTEAEKAELDKKMQESLAKANAMMGGIKNEVTIEFTSSEDVILKFKMKVNEETLKLAGVGWAKRKALKTALALAPSSEKAKYIVKGNLVITDPTGDPDTLRLSPDGKYLHGQFDKETDFKLTRTK